MKLKETEPLARPWRLLIALVSTILSLIFVELGARVLNPKLNLNALFRYHPALGWTTGLQAKRSTSGSKRKVSPLEFGGQHAPLRLNT
jgi:hypothetical protein